MFLALRWLFNRFNNHIAHRVAGGIDDGDARRMQLHGNNCPSSQKRERIHHAVSTKSTYSYSVLSSFVSTPFGTAFAEAKSHEAVVELGEEELASVSGGAPWLLVGAVLLLWPR
ncbi:MAG: hypothetical protein ACK59G_06690 [Cyanobacteriota bacterium]